MPLARQFSSFGHAHTHALMSKAPCRATASPMTMANAHTLPTIGSAAPQPLPQVAYQRGARRMHVQLASVHRTSAGASSE